ncbi:MAG: hypothetical protein UW52_C0064G0012 [Candidatus Gottesmanbacteria bacterium GW2011_GWA1_44_24b]|uniref:Uncharacterized protein n=1 Tax=Candidatus Gottesmanbacteria bacterium GW2011_GWA1_44_24b TaxID=1618437 RepID=A0A0G1LE85_9BACT|nr:MAG: hypothetical protein UW52_C0064G0012 [Candidatus Gottesmanbacteria bacterium GW2011_GWA1_44_24b]
MLQTFGLLSAVIFPISYFPYVRDTLRGKTKPERASWFIWATLGAIAFFSQLAKGATDSLWLSGLGTFFYCGALQKNLQSHCFLLLLLMLRVRM